MLQRFKNIILSLRSYPDLSPDLRIRRCVNRALQHRPALDADEWFDHFWQSREVAKPIADFVYTRMSDYSGLEFARVRPSDRLNDDLQWACVCWFDWQICLCEDFLACFGVDLSDHFDPSDLCTIEELVTFLNQQLLSVSHSNRP